VENARRDGTRPPTYQLAWTDTKSIKFRPPIIGPPKKKISASSPNIGTIQGCEYAVLHRVQAKDKRKADREREERERQLMML
jgi:hypothetical protein